MDVFIIQEFYYYFIYYIGNFIIQDRKEIVDIKSKKCSRLLKTLVIKMEWTSSTKKKKKEKSSQRNSENKLPSGEKTHRG